MTLDRWTPERSVVFVNEPIAARDDAMTASATSTSTRVNPEEFLFGRAVEPFNLHAPRKPVDPNLIAGVSATQLYGPAA